LAGPAENLSVQKMLVPSQMKGNWLGYVRLG